MPYRIEEYTRYRVVNTDTDEPVGDDYDTRSDAEEAAYYLQESDDTWALALFIRERGYDTEVYG